MKIRHSILPVVVMAMISFVFTACSDDDNIHNGGENPLKIEVSASEITLQPEKGNEEAIRFTWNTGNERGEGTTLIYHFKMDIADNNFETSIPKENMPEGVFSKSYNHEDLNDLLLEFWQVKAGESVDMEAKIIADVNNSSVYMKPEVAVVPFTVRTFVMPSYPLYLVGTATDAGMDPSKGIEINEVINGRTYSWKGNLKAGGFKFVSSQESMLPSLNKGEGENEVVERTDEEQPDDLFIVETEVLYGMWLDRREMTLVYHYMPYEYVYMVGDATPAKWNIDFAMAMDWSPQTPNLFTYKGWLDPGEIKLPLEVGNWDCDYLMPPGPNEPITGDWQEMMFVPQGAKDDKWIITGEQAGNYILTVDTETMQIKFEKQ